MNVIVLTGRITKDIELKYTPSNTAVINFNLAVNRSFKKEGQPDADFLQIVVWGKQAENVHKYCHKGSMIAVDGRVETRNYDNKDGNKVYVTEVIANSVQFLDSKTDNMEEAPKPKETEDPFAKFGDDLEETFNKHNDDSSPVDLPF